MSFNPEQYPVFRISAEFTDKNDLKWVMGGLYIAAPTKETVAKRVSEIIPAKQNGHQVTVSFRQCDEYEAKYIMRRGNGHDPFAKKSTWKKIVGTFKRGKDEITVT